MSKNQYTVGDGVRMVGQLLLHHPTTGYYAKDLSGHNCSSQSPQASCFCYEGALYRVSTTLGTHCMDVDVRISRMLFNTDYDMHAAQWDNATDAQRSEWAQKMADYKGA
jgi:hypothetical protein